MRCAVTGVSAMERAHRAKIQHRRTRVDVPRRGRRAACCGGPMGTADSPLTAKVISTPGAIGAKAAQRDDDRLERKASPHAEL